MCFKLFVALLIFIYICQVTLCKDVHPSANLSAIAYNHCPNNQFCKSRLDEPPPGVVSCCKPCSCDADCYIGQHCCPDSGIDQTNNVPLTCKSMDEHFNEHRNVSHMFGRVIVNYFAIDNCPPDYRDRTVIEECLVPRTLSQHVFVTDPVSKLIYKNYQCAMCNGVNHFESWDLRLECLYTDSFYSGAEYEKSILEQCSLNSVPMASPTLPNTQWSCDPEAISTCNVTGEWDVYDDVIVDACAEYNMHYLAKRFNAGTGNLARVQGYKNVFCFLCNTKAGETYANPTCESFPTHEKDAFGIPFESILNMHELQPMPSQRNTEDGCDVNEMFDLLSGRCTELLCPFGYSPVHGECISYMQDTNLTFTAIFEFNFTTENETSGTEDGQANGPMYDALFGTVQTMLEDSRCEYCRINIYQNVLVIRAITGTFCSNKILLQNFESMTRLLRIRDRNGEEKFPLKLRISAKYTYTTSGGPGSHRINVNGLLTRIRGRFVKRCANAVELLPKFNCKRMRFSPLEMRSNGVSKDKLAKVMDKSEADTYIDGVLKYAICMHDYMRIVSKGTVAGPSKFALLILTVSVLLQMRF